MTKVCHMTSAHTSRDTRIFEKECVSLSAAGFDTYLVARGESREDKGVHVIGVGEAPKKRLARMTSFAGKIYQTALALDADIYHFHDPELLPYGLKLKKQGKKVIFDSHENHYLQIGTKQYLPHWIMRIIAWVYYRYETYVCRRLDAVAIPCTFEQRNIFEGRAPRTVLLANYPILTDAQAEKPYMERSEGYLCYAGTISEENGITGAVKVAAALKRKLVLAGTFSSRAYEEALRAMPEFSWVDYRGYVSSAEVASIYEKAAIGYYIEPQGGQNGLLDTFGIKIYEYMAHALPFAVEEYPYARQVVDTYSCGLCLDYGDMEGITAAFTRLLENPREAQEMGLRGRKAAEQVFNWQMESKKLTALYHSLEKSAVSY